jgi:SAM-dependent methyltransferase
MAPQAFSSEAEKKIGDYWSQKSLKKTPSWNWWSCPQVIRHLNHRVCGVACNGVSYGLFLKAQEILSHKKLDYGISVGCGIGIKEMRLIQWGLVNRFLCFELSEERIQQAQAEAQRRGISHAIKFRREDAFSLTNLADFDLVHWNNSLHHMPDTYKAVEWSWNVLKSGGLFMMDDYVGPNYIQFSDRALEFASQLRKTFPKKYLTHPSSSPEKIVYVSPDCQRTDLSRVIAKDPSEAADAENILRSVRHFFPNATIVNTGGIVYFVTLPPLYPNFNSDDEFDRGFLESLLVIDDLYTNLHPEETLYATALAIKGHL